MNKIINYIKQPTAISCGPTCLKMAHTTILGLQDGEFPTIEEICVICGTDWFLGTPPDRMEKGIKALNMGYLEHINSSTPFSLLNTVIDNGNIPIIRTITMGVPHWVIPVSYIDDLYNIHDPWLGRIQYTIKELDKIWKPREYHFFEIKLDGNKKGDT